jgi:Glycosyl hydrolase catalytic core
MGYGAHKVAMVSSLSHPRTKGRLRPMASLALPALAETLLVLAGSAAVVAAAPQSTLVSTASTMPPMAAAATSATPYRYGILAHPFPFSLGHVQCSVYACNGGRVTILPDSERQFQLLCEAHTGYVRIDYGYAQIMTKNGSGRELLPTPNFTVADAIIDRLKRCGITELPIILQYAAGPLASGGRGESTPMAWITSNDPTNSAHIPGYADFAQIVGKHLAQKYPQISRIELFNEPNNRGWGSFPVGGSYESSTDESGREAALYMRAAYTAVKRSAPDLTVVGPAIADGGSSTDPRTFLQNMYDAGCRRGTCWDVLSVHNYAWSDPDSNPDHSRTRFDVYKDLQQIAAQHGDAETHVMLTEWGFSTQPGNQYAFSEPVQAVYIAKGFNRMLRDPTVDGVTYVNMYNPGTDFWGYTSLVRQDFTLKPAFFVFKRYAAARR